MQRSLPRFLRGRRSVRLPKQPDDQITSQSTPRSTSAASKVDPKPIYTRNVFGEGPTDTSSATVLEARMHATTEELPKKPYRQAGPARGDRWRPSPRIVPAGTALHLPNEHTMLGKTGRYDKRKKKNAEDCETPASLTWQSMLASPRLLRAGSPSNSTLRRPSFRRAYSTARSDIATTSAVTIEDLDEWKTALDEQAGRKFANSDRVIEEEEYASPPLADLEALSSDADAEDGLADAFAVENIKLETDTCIPQTQRELIRYLGRSIASGRTRDNLSKLRTWHDQFPTLRSTASYNYLLQLAYDIRDLRSFNSILLTDMPSAGCRPDSTTYDIHMETWARQGRWDRVVSVWNERRDAQIPLNRIGWTRVMRAATKRGTTTLSQAEIGKTLNPIYSALYDLPKGVRQLQLHKIVKNQKMDVDEMLSLMMPDDLLPLDFQATLAIAHRLVKQTRWKEAEDVVALWLDRTDATWEAAEPFLIPQETVLPLDHGDRITDEYRRAIATRKQHSLAFLHVMLEGLVLTRNPPEVVAEYVERYMTTYEKTAVAPTYHTLFLVLTACRLVPLKIRFQNAFGLFQRLESQYKPPQDSLADKYGLSRCFRQLEEYGRLTLESYKDNNLRKHRTEILEAISTDMQTIGAKIKSLQADSWRRQKDEAIIGRHSRKSRHGRPALPSNHLLQKEIWRNIQTAWDREGLDVQRRSKLPAPWQNSPWLRKERDSHARIATGRFSERARRRAHK